MDGHDNNGNPVIKFGKAGYEGGQCFHLKHSCDEWIIGGTEQAKEFIAILQKLVDENPDVPSVEFRDD